MSNIKNLFKAEDFINLTELPLGDAQEQAQQIAERCQELLEQYGFAAFLKEYCPEFQDHIENSDQATKSYLRKRAG